MKSAGFALVGLAALAVGCAGLPDSANAQSGYTIHGKARGHCKLTNVQYGRELYNGTCVIKQSVSGNSSVYSISMGTAEPFLFATSDGGKSWMHGPEQVRFRDRGHSGIFRWSNFRLEVDDEF